jgi:hypothetical protein
LTVPVVPPDDVDDSPIVAGVGGPSLGIRGLVAVLELGPVEGGVGLDSGVTDATGGKVDRHEAM